MKGVTPIDHAADVGIDVRAQSLTELFCRAAAGMTGLVLADQEIDPTSGPTVTHDVELQAVDGAALLVAWLRELLYLNATQGFIYLSADFGELTEARLRARAHGVIHEAAGRREIKGVTYHGLRLSHGDGEWHGRVIFDV